MSLAVAICAITGLLGGILLRKIACHKRAVSVSRRSKAMAAFLCIVCGAMVMAGCGAAREYAYKIYISEICQKTKVCLIDPEMREELGEESREISYVIISNPGPLDYEFQDIYLSEQEENLTALRFTDICVPAQGSCRLTMDYEHGIDLSKKGESAIYLSTGKERMLDMEKVPVLEEYEIYCINSKGGAGSFLNRYALEKPVFSKASGFYSEGFDLTISAPEGVEIYYTLDCSDPMENGILYTGPIRIVDRTEDENIWSKRRDVSAAFVATNDRYSIPDEAVDKCTVVRAVCRDNEGNRSRIGAESYFISFDERDGYEGVGVISISGDPDDLFGYEKGIYVLGKVFDEKHGTEREGLGWWWWPANYHQKGRAWEREVDIQFFDTERQIQTKGTIGLRIKGGASAGMLPKGLNLFAREEYGMNVFDFDFFGDGYKAKRLSLSGGGNDVNLKVRDWLTTRLARELDLTMNRFVPYCLFLNGEYWGNYWLIEQYDDVYFAHVYGLTKDNVVVQKNGKLKAGIDTDNDLESQLIRAVKKLDLSVEENYNSFCEMIDVDNIVKYYALEIYIGNEDRGLRKNAAFWRTRVPEDSQKGDTRWRAAVFDTNSHSCYESGDADTITYTMEKDAMFTALMKNNIFQEKFYAMLRFMATEIFTPGRAEEALQEFDALMAGPMAKEFKRFNTKLSDLSELKQIRTFMYERQNYILDLCSAYETNRNSEERREQQ